MKQWLCLPLIQPQHWGEKSQSGLIFCSFPVPCNYSDCNSCGTAKMAAQRKYNVQYDRVRACVLTAAFSKLHSLRSKAEFKL